MLTSSVVSPDLQESDFPSTVLDIGVVRMQQFPALLPSKEPWGRTGQRAGSVRVPESGLGLGSATAPLCTGLGGEGDV